MLRIGLDLDGVAYEWGSVARFLLSHHFGYILEKEASHWWAYRDAVKKEHWRWLWDEGVRNHGLFRHGHLYKGTVEALENLRHLGRIIVITARPETARQDTLDWLAFHQLPVSEFHLLAGESAKSSVRPFCDLYVDDSPGVVQDLSENTPGVVLCWDRPWNQSLVADGNVRRVSSWLEVINEARRLKILEAA